MEITLGGVAGLLLSSVVLAAFINKLFDFIISRRNRRDTLADRRNSTDEQIEELRTETGEKFDQVNSQIEDMSKTVNGRMNDMSKSVEKLAGNTELVMKSSRAQAYDRIRFLGLTYIKAGKVSAEELHTLMELHTAYKCLGGDGFLDRIMEEVHKLHIVDDT